MWIMLPSTQEGQESKKVYPYFLTLIERNAVRINHKLLTMIPWRGRWKDQDGVRFLLVHLLLLAKMEKQGLDLPFY